MEGAREGSRGARLPMLAELSNSVSAHKNAIARIG